MFTVRRVYDYYYYCYVRVRATLYPDCRPPTRPTVRPRLLLRCTPHLSPPLPPVRRGSAQHMRPSDRRFRPPPFAVGARAGCPEYARCSFRVFERVCACVSVSVYTLVSRCVCVCVCSHCCCRLLRGARELPENERAAHAGGSERANGMGGSTAEWKGWNRAGLCV